MTSFLRLSPLLGVCILLSLVLSSCQAPSPGMAEKKGLFGGNKKWRSNMEDGQGALAGEWNSLPRGNLAGADSSYSRVNISEPYLALTFDDGPHPTHTPRLLDILKARNVKATFYVVGKNAKAYPHILQRMVAEGHEVANHTWNHPYLTKISSSSVSNELGSTRDAIIQATGVAPLTYRPPYGAVNSSLKTNIQREFGYPTVMWSVDPLDWKKPGASVVADRLVSGAHNGAILLAHDIHGSTIDAMPSTVDRLLQRGYRFVTVSQLINLERRGSASAAPPAPNPTAPTYAPAPEPGMARPVPNPIPVSRDSAESAPEEAVEEDAESAPEELVTEKSGQEEA